MRKILSIFIAPIIIFVMNAAFILPLFQGGYTHKMGSIESVFIADARFIFENFPHLSWNQYWYTGFPFHTFYTPLLPYLMAFLHWIFGVVSIESWYRILIGLFYALTPVSLYFLVRFLTNKNWLGFLAAVFYSFLPSIGYVINALGGWNLDRLPLRLITLMLYGEGGHIVGLFFLPLALLFFIKTMREASLKNVLLAVMTTGLLALANMIALIGFAIMLVIVLAVESIGGDRGKKLGRVVTGLLFTFGSVAFWYNLSFMKASFSIGTGGVAGGVGETYLRSLPILFFIIPVLFVFASLGKKHDLRPVLMAMGWVAIFFTAAYLWLTRQTMILPQPNRYVPEMDMGTSLLLAWLVVFLAGRAVLFFGWLTVFLAGERLRLNLNWMRKVIYVGVIVLVLYFPKRNYKEAWVLTAPHPDITQTSEYRVASWFKDNTQGERVFATGSSAFWLNTFADRWQTPQVRGGNDGVVGTPWILHGVFQINTSMNAPKGQEGEVAVWWLRVFNVSYAVVNFPSSKEVFHDYIYPEKFEQVEGVTKAADLNGDIIYKMPIEQPSLAQVVKKSRFENLVVLKNAVDIGSLKNYVDYIDASGGKETKFTWTGVGQAKIEADVQPGEGIALQIPYNSGWKAYLDNQKTAVKKDVLGFMFLDPRKTGKIEVKLVYGRTADVYLGYFLTLLTLGAWFLYPKLSKRASETFKRTEKRWQQESDEYE